MKKEKSLKGYAIVVADRGFVYVGETEITDDWCIIQKARNIRYWGTSKGLGELALNGPLEKTKLDNVGTVLFPIKAIMHVIDTEVEKWKE